MVVKQERPSCSGLKAQVCALLRTAKSMSQALSKIRMLEVVLYTEARRTALAHGNNVCAFSLYSFAPLFIRSVLWLRRYEMGHCLSQEKIFRYSHY